jgi:3'-phosphoadenosine 5'-phosphosulfate sulfotransferase (PAPS reductase)/FAD synthetase
MPDKWVKTFQMWSKTKEHKQRLEQAKKNIKHVLEYYNPIVLFSGGKDSLVLLHMVMHENNQIPVYYSDSGYDYDSQQIKMPTKMTKEILEIGKKAGAQTIYSCGHKDPNSRRFFGNLFKVMKKHNCDLELLGIRAGESTGRKNRTKGKLVRVEGSRRIAFPIRGFDWKDVWSYIISNNIEYLSYYDKYARVEGYDKVRLSSRFSKGLLHKGGSLYLDGVLMPEYRNERPMDWDK